MENEYHALPLQKTIMDIMEAKQGLELQDLQTDKPKRKNQKER